MSLIGLELVKGSRNVGTKQGQERIQLGRAVRIVRTELGLSQEALGEAGGLHRNYVGAIERGEINPTFMLLLLRLSRGLEMSLAELMDRYESLPPARRRRGPGRR